MVEILFSQYTYFSTKEEKKDVPESWNKNVVIQALQLYRQTTMSLVLVYGFSVLVFSERYTRRGLNLMPLTVLPPKGRMRRSVEPVQPEVAFSLLEM
jgi:hypothetical protein